MQNGNEEGNSPAEVTPAETTAEVPPISQQHGGRTTETVKASEEAPASKRELHILEKINIYGQLGLVVLGGIAASIYGCQLQQMKRTVENTETYFRTDERAWVEIEPIKPVLLDNNPKFGATFTCDVYLKNVGKTVATDIVVKARDEFSNEELGNNRSMMANAQDKFLLDKFTEMETGNPVRCVRLPRSAHEDADCWFPLWRHGSQRFARRLCLCAHRAPLLALPKCL